MDAKIVVLEVPQKTTLWISKREFLVIERTVKGESNEEIAQAMGLSKKTVEGHKHRALKRLQCRNLYQVIGVLFRQNILS